MSLPDIFEPAVDTVKFRKALGRFATGIAVVTAQTANGPIGLTINSFASVSLDPPLVLWSAARSSSRYAAFVGAEAFAVHVLAGGQKSLCDHFTRSARGFEALAHTLGDRGVPLLSGCTAVFECVRETVHEAGDHSIILARVARIHTGENSALVFRDGQIERAG